MANEFIAKRGLIVQGAMSASFAYTTASWANNSKAATSASWASSSISASYALTASRLNSDTNAFIQGGNAFGATATLGTTDNRSLSFVTSGSSRMIVSASGFVTINKTDQVTQSYLQVYGNMGSGKSTAIIWGSMLGGSSVDGILQLRDGGSNKVVGVFGGAGTSTPYGLFNFVADVADGRFGELNFMDRSSGGDARAATIACNAAGAASGELLFITRNGGFNYGIHIDKNGNVCIKQGSPAGGFGLDINAHAGPSSDNVYDLGSPTVRWANLYCGTLATITNISSSDINTTTLTASFISGTLIGVDNIWKLNSNTAYETAKNVGIDTDTATARIHINDFTFVASTLAATPSFTAGSDYLAGDQVEYRGWGFKNLNGIVYFAPTASLQQTVIVGNDGDSPYIEIGSIFGDGIRVERNVNSLGWLDALDINAASFFDYGNATAQWSSPATHTPNVNDLDQDYITKLGFSGSANGISEYFGIYTNGGAYFEKLIVGTSSLALTSSTAITASFLLGSISSASYAGTASVLLGSVTSASYALLASTAVTSSYISSSAVYDAGKVYKIWAFSSAASTQSLFATQSTNATSSLTASYISSSAIFDVGKVYNHTASFATTTSYARGIPTTKAGIRGGGGFTGSPQKSTITFTQSFVDNNYAISVVGDDSRTWTIESKVSGSFVINSNSNVAMTVDVYWTATQVGEFYS